MHDVAKILGKMEEAYRKAYLDCEHKYSVYLDEDGEPYVYQTEPDKNFYSSGNDKREDKPSHRFVYGCSFYGISPFMGCNPGIVKAMYSHLADTEKEQLQGYISKQNIDTDKDLPSIKKYIEDNFPDACQRYRQNVLEEHMEYVYLEPYVPIFVWIENGEFHVKQP